MPAFCVQPAVREADGLGRPMGGRLKLGQLLVNKKLITPEQLQAALGEHEQWGSLLGVTLVRLGFLRETSWSGRSQTSGVKSELAVCWLEP